MAISSTVCLVVGVAVLVGWAFEISILKQVVPGFVSMKPNAAIGFVLLSAVLLGRLDQGATLRAVASCATFALGLLASLTLAEYAFDCNLGIGELLFRDTDAGQVAIRPGSMSPVAATNFILLAVAAILPTHSNLFLRWGKRICVLVPLILSARALLGYLLWVPTLYQIGQSTAIALHTTIAFVVASIGLLLSHADSSLVTILCGGGMGSRIARRQLVWVCCFPVGLSLCCCYAEAFGWFSSQTGLTFFVVLTLPIFAALLISWSRLVDQVDKEQQLATASAKAFRQASEQDPLTGILNRRGFLERCEQQLAKTSPAENRLACLVLDIDYFKKINDVHGHGVGDIVLCQFATLLKSVCKASDIIGRIGGEEFCVIFPETDEAGAKEIAERLRIVVAVDGG
jgi:GGDEF domain-containing protein